MKGKIKTWGIQEVEKLDGAPKMVIVFDTEAGDRKWESFFFKKDGEVNSMTMKTLALCGFTGSDLTKLESCDNASLDMRKEYDLELEVQAGGYEVVKWVNDPNRQAATFGLSNKKKLSGMKLNKALQDAQAQHTKPPETKESDEIPF